jgi:hypothetical protein
VQDGDEGFPLIAVIVVEDDPEVALLVTGDDRQQGFAGEVDKLPTQRILVYPPLQFRWI